MHENIALNGCECMVGKSTLCMVFDWVGSVNGTTSNRVARLIKMVKKICVVFCSLFLQDQNEIFILVLSLFDLIPFLFHFGPPTL